VAALHLAVAKNTELVRYQDLSKTGFGETELRHKIAALTEALLEHGRVPAGQHSGVFIQDVLIQTRGRTETTRRVFMETLHRLLAALEARRSIDDGDLADLESGITLRIETAFGLNEMVGRFEAALELLLSFLERPVSGDRYFRIHKACEAIKASLHEPWTLPFAARQFGLSNTTFSREFSRHAGMPFSEFLLARRLDKAQRLLHDGLPLEQVAETCGFRSANYFIQIFKRKVGTSPGKFSRQHRP
jgi:AraC-like DNA-binding protein